MAEPPIRSVVHQKISLKHDETFKLTVDDEEWNDSELEPLDKFFELLESSTIDELILNNVEENFEKEISKFVFQKSKYSVKNFTFHQNCSTKIVVWIVNKCGLELDGIFLRGSIQDSFIQRCSYIYETQLLRMKEAPLTNKIDRLKSIFGNYKFSPKSFVQFLTNFAKFNPAETRLFFETRFRAAIMKNALGALLENPVIKTNSNDVLLEVTPEKVAVFKFRPNGVMCTVVLNDESIKSIKPIRKRLDPDFDYSSLSPAEILEIGPYFDAFYDVYYTSSDNIHRFEKYLEDVELLKQNSDMDLSVRTLRTLKLKFTKKSVVMIGKEDGAEIYERQEKKDLDNDPWIFNKFLQLLESVAIEDLYFSSFSEEITESVEVFRRTFSKMEKKLKRQTFSISTISFSAKTPTTLVVPVIAHCDNSLAAIFMRGVLEDAKDMYSNFAYETELVRMAAIHMVTKIDCLKSIFSAYKFNTWTFSKFLMNFTQCNPIGAKLFVETRLRKHKLFFSLKNIIGEVNCLKSFGAGSKIVELPSKISNFRYTMNGVFCSMEKEEAKKQRHCHRFEDYLKNEDLIFNLRLDLIGSRVIWTDLPEELKILCIRQLDEKTRISLSMCSQYEKSLIFAKKRQFKLVELVEISTPHRGRHSYIHSNTPGIIELWATDVAGKRQRLCLFKEGPGWKTNRTRIFDQLVALIRSSKIETLQIDVDNEIEQRGTAHLHWKNVTESDIDNLELEKTLMFLEYPFLLNSKAIFLKEIGCVEPLRKIVKYWIETDANVLRKAKFAFGTFSVRHLSRLREFQWDGIFSVVAENDSEFRLATNNPKKHIIVKPYKDDVIECAEVDADLKEIPPSFF